MYFLCGNVEMWKIPFFFQMSWSCVNFVNDWWDSRAVKARCESHFTARFAAASSTVGRKCVNNEQNSKGPGSRRSRQQRCVKTNDVLCFELSQFCHNFSERKMERGFKIMVLQWCLFMGDWLIDWLIGILGFFGVCARFNSFNSALILCFCDNL